MAYIYKITNEINDKVYIGKTMFSLEKRWEEHKRDSLRLIKEHRPLYSAMKKYGIDKFQIELIEETDSQKSALREQYWIEYYKGYTEGYNATLGGDSRHYIDYALVIKTYGELQSLIDTATFLGIHEDSVRKILIEAKVPILSRWEVRRRKSGKKVDMFTLDNEYVQTFDTMCDAGIFLIEQRLTIITDVKKLSNKVSRVCRGLAHTAYGFLWKFHEDITDVNI